MDFGDYPFDTRRNIVDGHAVKFDGRHVLFACAAMTGSCPRCPAFVCVEFAGQPEHPGKLLVRVGSVEVLIDQEAIETPK